MNMEVGKGCVTDNSQFEIPNSKFTLGGRVVLDAGILR